MKKVLFSVVLFLLLVSCCSGLCEIVTAGNSFNSSLQITIGNEYTCQLKASAKDYFRFATEKESGFYYFTLRNNNVDGPLYIEILDEAGIRIGRTRSYKNE